MANYYQRGGLRRLVGNLNGRLIDLLVGPISTAGITGTCIAICNTGTLLSEHSCLIWLSTSLLKLTLNSHSLSSYAFLVASPDAH